MNKQMYSVKMSDKAACAELRVWLELEDNCGCISI